jgi:hypothetical protein
MADTDNSVLLALAEAATPPGQNLPHPGQELVSEVASVAGDLYGRRGVAIHRALVRSVEMSAIPLTGQRLSRLPPQKRAEVLAKLNRNPATHWPLRAALAPLKAARARNPAFLRAIGASAERLPVVAEKERWHEQIIDARTLLTDETLEVDVVIVGTGAGGAPLANALAAQGHAVLMVEEGGHYTRADFDGNGLRAQKRMFRQGGMTAAFGNTVFPVPTGQTVGGSTTINSGTCYRIPESVHRRWVLENGLVELGPGSLDAFYERVESMLQVQEATQQTLGGCARVIARGAEALGLAHGPLMRNAPACDGQGLCCFGCPTDAKRSTNVSYVPAALKKGAMVYCNAHVNELITERGRAVGVKAVARLEGGGQRKLTVRAHVVVLSGGALGTPGMLLQSGLANRSDQVGRQLTVHPAGYAYAHFDEDIRGWAAIPQGYAIEEFVDQGLRFEGAFLPVDLAAAALSQVGDSWTALVDRFEQLACFGFMVADSSRGRVSLNRNGRLQIRYRVNDQDLQLMIRGHAILARVYLAAGATEVYPGLSEPWDVMRNEADVLRFEREAPERLKARHVSLTAFHPLGSCRMHADPLRGVTSSTGETHQVGNLFICDGSAVPGPLGVNPQMTIMALSERSAQFVERRIEEASQRHSQSSAAPNRATRRVEFSETMAGQMRLTDGPEVDVEFEVRATLDVDRKQQLSERGATFVLEGMLRMPGVAEAAPCHGTLRMRPLKRKATLRYELEFEADDGRTLALSGDKNVSLLRTVRGMTTLYTVISHGSSEVARGTLLFDIKTVLSFLWGWRITRK